MNAAEKYTPFDRWLEESKNVAPWSCLAIPDIQSFDEAASVEEGVGDGEA
jgi:hypothetical protein